MKRSVGLSLIRLSINLFPPLEKLLVQNPDELAALLMIELAFQMGATHSPQSIMGMLAAVADAARAGLEAASNQENEIPDPIEQSLLDMECPIVKH